MKKEIVEIDGKYAARFCRNIFSVWRYVGNCGELTYTNVSDILRECLHNHEYDAQKSMDRYLELENPKVVKEIK